MYTGVKYVKKLIPIVIMGMLVLSGLGAVAVSTDTQKVEQGKQVKTTFTHTVFAEDGTATWCVHCPYAHGSLNRLYQIGTYPFFYTSLVVDKNTHASARTAEYNAYGWPTVWFDGGYQTDCGSYDNWQQQMSWYNQTLVQCGARTVANIDVALNVAWLGDAAMDITIDVKNNEANPYAGHLRIYVTEVESSMGWIDTQGHKYTFPFLDYAFNGPITIASGDTYTNTINWDGHNYNDGNGHNFGSIQYGNVEIIAAVFNNTMHQGYSNPPSGNPFNAYYVDDAAGFLVGGNAPPNVPSNPSPADGATNVGVNTDLSWTGGDPDSGDTVTYDVYFGTSSPPPLVASGITGTTYDPGTMTGAVYYWQIGAKDNQGASTMGPLWHFVTVGEAAPGAPTVTGPAKGKPGTPYSFNFVSTDPDADTLSYSIDWGDSTTTNLAGPYDSGVQVSVNHTYSVKGTYTVKAKAKDVHGLESDWGTFQFKAPVSSNMPFLPFWEQLFERYPNIFPLLRHLLGY
jgi:hypothetical protein